MLNPTGSEIFSYEYERFATVSATYRSWILIDHIQATLDWYILETLAELNWQIHIIAPEGISADISRSHRLMNSSESCD